MRIVLQCNEKFLRKAYFDIKTGHIESFDIERNDYNNSGSYSYCEDDLLALYAHENSIFAFFGGTKIRLNPNHVAKMETHPEHNVLRIFEGKKEIFSYKYIPEQGIVGDMTPFHEREDDDYLFFMANIINSQERQNILLGSD